MKYKWKDKVRIKSKKELESISEVTDGMLKNGGAIMTIACLVEDADGYIMKEDGDFHFLWSDEMIEGLVEEETKPLTTENMDKIIEEAKTYWDSIKDAWICPEGYVFKDENGNVINAKKIVLEKKKKEYPKTYEECCKVLSLGEDGRLYTKGYKASLIQDFQKLLICRDAYWKIAGYEMGLGKPWEPDWKSDDVKYTISTIESMLTRTRTCYDGAILAFPTIEMRDAFYENFKELINSCKELL